MVKGSILGLAFFGTLAAMLWLDWRYGVATVAPFGKGEAGGLQLFLMLGTVIYPIWLTGTIAAAARRLLYRRAAAWPQAEAKIMAFDTGVTLGRGAHYWADCRYAYTVAGTEYHGAVHTSFSGGLINQGDDADRYQASHPVGGSLLVRYDPARPSRSVVLEYVPQSAWDIFWFMLIPLLPAAMLFPGIRAAIWR